MKNLLSITAFILLTAAVHSCKTAVKTQGNSEFNYDDLYKVWVVDTVLFLGDDVVSTPNIETDKNEYQFTKAGSDFSQGTRTTMTSGASFDVSYTIKDDIINFDPAATFPLLKFDENKNLISSNMNMSLPPYKIIELTPKILTLKNKDILLKLKAK